MVSVSVALVVFGVACGGGDLSEGPDIEAGPTSLRRLTAEQYANSIHDVLGLHIVVPSRIDPDDRRDGLLSVGASFVSISSSGFEKYEVAATTIAEQALDAEHRDSLVPCAPNDATAADADCAREFLSTVGRRLLRRRLTTDELDARVQIANEASAELEDFYAGLQLALTSLLVSPDFLFRIEDSSPDPDSASGRQLSSTALASRLSYLFWNSTPDDELLDAAEDDSLQGTVGLVAQVERLAESPRVEAGLRAFFSDVYDFKQFDDGLVRKDITLFPAYSQELAEDAKEQTLRTIVAHLNAGKDFRDLFTTRETFLNRRLGLIYQVPVAANEGFEAHTFDEDGPRAGILSHLSFMSLHAHAGRSSATLRGKFVREVLLCQDVPSPPGNVDFSIVEDTMGELRTARERLERHVTDDGCASCHNSMDPIGLGFENFDGIGAYRTQENGADIDASGDIDGVAYDDAKGMGEVLRNHPRVGSCLVRTLFRYATGRNLVATELPLLDYLNKRFARSHYRVHDLLRDIVLTDGFRATSGPRIAEVLEEAP